MNGSLKVRGLSAGYGEVGVLDGVSLDAAAGEVTAVIGSNGAGKTTLMRTLAGLLVPTAGSISLDGRDITGTSTHELVADGLILVPEGRLVFPELTVRENLILGSVCRRARSGRDEAMAQAFELFPRLHERQSQAAGTLSGGEQQMLALGRGLMGRPRVLLLDEPTLGLAPSIAKQIFQVIPRLAALGITVVLSEQDVRRTLRTAANAAVLENGRVAISGPGAAIAENPAVRRAYLGR